MPERYPIITPLPDHYFISQRPHLRHFFEPNMNTVRRLGELRLQKQAYDHVLRESDRERDAFAAIVGYILRNPERQQLVEDWKDWAYTGASFSGYPSLDPGRNFSGRISGRRIRRSPLFRRTFPRHIRAAATGH